MYLFLNKQTVVNNFCTVFAKPEFSRKACVDTHIYRLQTNSNTMLECQIYHCAQLHCTCVCKNEEVGTEYQTCVCVCDSD